MTTYEVYGPFLFPLFLLVIRDNKNYRSIILDKNFLVLFTFPEKQFFNLHKFLEKI